jgi:hypothetical protein
VLFTEFIKRYRGTPSEKVFSTFDERVRHLVGGIPDNEISRIFEGSVFYNTEIIHPEFDGVVRYNTFKVVIHPTGHRSHINESVELSKTLDLFKKYEGDFLLINSVRTSRMDVNDKLDEVMDELRSLLKREGLRLSHTIGDFVGKKMFEIASRVDIPAFKQKMLAKRLMGRKGARLNHIYSGQSTDRVAEIRNIVSEKNNLLREAVAPIRRVVDRAYTLFLENFNPSIKTEGDLKSEGIVFTYNERLLKLTGVYADLIREKNSDPIGKFALIPGSFKPPHKGHLQMFEHYAGICDKVYVVVSNGLRRCSEGVEYTAEQTRRVLNEFIALGNLDNVVFLFDDHPHKKIISLINDPRVIKSESVVFVGASSKGGDHEKGAYIYAERDDIKLLEAKETNYSIKEDLSSTDLRDHITRGDADKVRFFVPEGVDHRHYMEIFGLNNIAEKKTKESTSPSFSLDETPTMAGGSVHGGAGAQGGPWINRKEFIDEIKLRKGIRKVVENIRNKQDLKEQRLRNIVKRMLMEKLSPPPTDSTGINVLRTLLKKIIVQLEDGYKELTTEPEQRNSFRAHILTSVQNLLAPIEATEQGAEEEGAALAQEEIQVDIGRPEDDPEFISIEDEPAEPEEEKPEDKFVEIPGEDETGRNISGTTFKSIAPQIANSYEQLSNQKDQDTFYEYLLTNIKLYFDKFEDEMASMVPEPETSSYDEGEVEVIDA